MKLRPSVPVLLLATAAVCVGQVAYGQQIKPLKEVEGLETVEKRGDQIPRNIQFRNHLGALVPLGTLFDGTQPVLLSLNYARCPQLCGLQIQGVIEAVKDLSLTPGKQFRYVSVSIDPLESYQTAATQRTNFIRAIEKDVQNNGIEFLTGTPEAIRDLADAVGFKYRYLRDKKQYVHPPVLISLTPDGVISRYFYDVKFEPTTLRLSLGEASDGQISSVFDQILFTCFQYNSTQGRYTLAAWKALRFGAVLTLIALGLFLFPVWLRASRSQQPKTALNAPVPESDLDASEPSITMPKEKVDS